MPDPKPPNTLDGPGRALWRSVVAEYDLQPHQLKILEHAAMATDRAHTAAKAVRSEGVTTLDRFGAVKAHPAVGIERDARLAVARLLRELALDPEDEPVGARPPRIRAVS